MNSLSLSPRFDLFRLSFPKELIPDEIYDKWYNLMNDLDKQVFRNPIDIINESIQGVEITGVSDGGVEQEQTGRNTSNGRIEPSSKVVYRNSSSDLSLMNNSLVVTFRHTQGFYTYFLLFESWFWHYAKTTKDDWTPFLSVDILDEDGVPVAHVVFKHPVFTAIDSLSLSFNKVDRSQETFTCTFNYSDIDFELGPSETPKS